MRPLQAGEQTREDVVPDGSVVGDPLAVIDLTDVSGAIPEDFKPVIPASEQKLQWDVEYYAKGNPGNFTDERWKSELNDRQLRIFRLVAGWTNRKLGYPPALDRQTDLPLAESLK